MSAYNPFTLEEKTILVTGASSGIGRAIAIACSKMGARLLITGRNKERLESTFLELEGSGHNQIIADLTEKEDLSALVENSGELDGLVNNAGVSMRLLVKDITDKALGYVMDSNFTAPVFLTRMLLKKKKIKKEASIVFISSKRFFWAYAQNILLTPGSKPQPNNAIMPFLANLSW